MTVCHECGAETSDLHYCDGEGCTKQLCNDCGPTCSSCLEYQETMQREEEERNKLKLAEKADHAMHKLMTDGVDKAIEKGFMYGYKAWSTGVRAARALTRFRKTGGPLADESSYWGNDDRTDISDDIEGEEVTSERSEPAAEKEKMLGKPIWWFDASEEEEAEEEQIEASEEQWPEDDEGEEEEE